MIVAIDVQYGETDASVGCVVFSGWADARPGHSFRFTVQGVEPYVPGQFYKRELPCIHAALAKLERMPDIVIVDSYVWLDGDGQKGLGAHLFDALGGAVAVVGVAKSAFRGSAHAQAVLRGSSQSPLYVTAAGIGAQAAADAVRSMHGPHREPTMLKQVDSLCRGR